MSRASPVVVWIVIFLGKVFIMLVVWCFMFNPKRLKVLDRAIDLVDVVRDVTMKFPGHERYELGRQMRRACESIGSNITEGNSRGTKEYVYFLKVAIGSANELEAQLKMVGRLGYLSEGEIEKVINEVVEIRKMIFGVIKFLEKKKD